MNPHQKNKVDVKSLSPEEQRLFRLYGKLPSKSDHFAKHLKERKYFDSGDYAMSKAGKGDSVDTGSVGSQHPVPENIPHLTSPSQNNSAHSGFNGGPPAHQHHPSVSGAQGSAGSPVKEASFLNQETSAPADDAEKEKPAVEGAEAAAAAAAAAAAQGIPIRR
ncbi:Endosulfine-domain-containing protein [Whalleya microplaca]|nr:Endosulfine-domain-containing protein [Whalleya microplaca]